MLVSLGLNRSLPPLALGLLLAAAAMAAALWAHLPLVNGPLEWHWAYRPPGLAVTGLAIAAAGVALVLLAAAGGSGEERWRLAALLAGGAAFTFGLAAAQPGGFGRVLDALVSRNAFGFVWDAGLAPDRRALLADYPAASRDLNQHSLTHPPGPLLAVRALDRLVSLCGGASLHGAGSAQAAPPATGAGAAGESRTRARRAEGAATAPGSALPAAAPKAAPSPAGRAARAIARARIRAGYHGQPVPTHLPGAATVALLAWLLPAASLLAAWPLHRLALACGLGRRGALLAAALWMLVPARSLFTPSLDQALPLLLLSAAWLAAGAGSGPRGLLRLAAAGALLWCASFLSYGCLAALPIVGAMAAASAAAKETETASAAAQETVAASAAAGATVAASAPAGPTAGEQAAARRAAGLLGPALSRLAATGLGLLAPWVVLALGTGFDPWQAFRAALRLHHEIAVAPRGYATWLLGNPWDFALLAGPPVLGLAVAALGAARGRRGDPRALRGLDLGTSRALGAPAVGALYWSFWAVMAVLWLSGSVRGEVGRIWLPWMPFACLLAAATLERWGREERAAAVALLLAQAALAVTLAANLEFVT